MRVLIAEDDAALGLFLKRGLEADGHDVNWATDGQTAIEAFTQTQTQRDALSAVNTNDEASALSIMERAYQASSKVFTILDQIFASAINLGEEATVA